MAELVRVIAQERSLLTQMASKEMVDAAPGAREVPAAVEARWDAELARNNDAARHRCLPGTAAAPVHLGALTRSWVP